MPPQTVHACLVADEDAKRCNMGYSQRAQEALLLSMELHGRQVRKGTPVPSITHLWGVAAIVGEHCGTEDEIIAVLLHDVLED